MKTIQKKAFTIIGISIRTSNEKGKSGTEIAQLWDRFMRDDIMNKIPGKLGDEIYSVYTNYEHDHTQPYDTILGCRVSSGEKVPEGMVSLDIPTQTYAVFQAKGNLREGNVVYEAWLKIFEAPLNRSFIADFEIFGKKATDPTNAEVDILVGIHE